MSHPRQLIYESDESLIYIEDLGSKKQIVKILHAEFPTPDQILRFNNEYEYTHNLNIPGIRKSLGKRKENEHSVLLLEYVEGKTLDATFEGPVDLVLGLHIFIKLAQSLRKLHEIGLIHKDINSNNVLWDTVNKVPVIIDFGISSQLDHINNNLGNPEKIKGTLTHMSPEQTGRVNRQIDNRSDLYSLGVTMFKLLTGKLPFEAKDALELVHMHIAKPAPFAHHHNSNIPEIVSGIIAKLLSKNADDRFQTAYGLEYDLQKCLEQLEAKGSIDIFTIGLEDNSGQFRIPQKLYGRQEELDVIYNSFERVCKGGNEFMLVSGYSGIGKSALVMELYKPITENKGFFVKGKFDQYQRNIPYFAIIQAFNEFCNLLLTENADRLKAWKHAIVQSLGDNGSVMTAFVPLLEKIIGKQPPVPHLEAQESQNRFRLVLHKFINAICTKEHPFVLFIDDLQWADVSSLGLIQSLVCDPTNHYLMIIGAYRDNEVTAAHPLMNMIKMAEGEGAVLNTIELKPLKETDVFQLIRDSLVADNTTVKELTDIIYSKTQGNVFFTIEFLKSLRQYDLIRYDFDTKKWEVNFAAIHKLGISNNVVDLLVSKIKMLPAATQEAMKLASCIGASFSIQNLSTIVGKNYQHTLADLWDAIKVGLLRPVNDNYQFIGLDDDNKLPDVEIEFVHDRIQQAFYSLIAGNKLAEVHLKIARLLLKNYTSGNDLFDVVNHYNEALALIDTDVEREEVAKMNFFAAQQAKRSSAYQPALAYIKIAAQLTGDEIWERDYSLALDLYKAMADIEYLNGNFTESESYINICLQNAKQPIEKADLYFILVQNQTNRALYYEAIDAARQGLEMLDFTFPAKDDCPALIPEQMGKIFQYFTEHGVASVYDKQEIKDPKILATINILDNLSPPTYVTGETNMWILHVLFKVNLTIEYGISPQGGYAFVELGLLFFIMNNYTFAYPSAQLSKRIAEKFRNESPRHLSRVGHLYTNYCTPWVKHISETVRLNPQYYQISLDSGELVYAGYTCFLPHYNSYFLGAEPVDSRMNQLSGSIDFCGKIHHDLAYDSLRALQMGMANVTNRTSSAFDFNLPDLTEADFLARCIERKDYYGMTMLNLIKSHAFYLSGELNAAYESLQATEKLAAVMAGCAVQSAIFQFIYALTLYGLLPEAGDKKEEYIAKINAFRAQMKIWSDNNPSNFEHLHLLLEAEWERIEGNITQAIENYTRAIASAEKNEFGRETALINMKAGEFWLGIGNKIYAQPHLSKARYLFKKLGYQRMVNLLDSKYLGLGLMPGRSEMVTRTMTTTITNTSGSMEGLDLSSIIKASNALSEEIVLDKLLEKMLRILVENAGAERGVFILNWKGELFVQAEANTDSVKIYKDFPLDTATNICLPAVYYAARTLDNLVIEDAQDQTYFADPYITQANIRSLLCTRILHHGEVIGILYLENNLTVGAFTEDRLEVLNILSAQAAISIENALLYNDLENKVMQRTHELSEEKKKSDDLLLNILPEEIANELKQTGKTKPRSYDLVTVMFTDFKDFTAESENLSPEDLVTVVDKCFKKFDEITGKYNIEKIKTIGDAYLCVSGLPVQADHNAGNVLKAALEIIDYIKQFRAENQQKGGASFDIRIGIHTGPIVAGVVGNKKFAYDIWGDTVNTAARMEQTSETNRINISESTYNLIKDDFICESRGKQFAKNKGLINMYYVNGVLSPVMG